MRTRADFADVASADARVVYAYCQIRNHHLREFVHGGVNQVRGMGALEVIARPHNHIETRLQRDTLQRFGVAPDGAAGGVDNRLPAVVTKLRDLFGSYRFVEQATVVEVHKRIVAQQVKNIRADLLVGKLDFCRLKRLLPGGSGV